MNANRDDAARRQDALRGIIRDTCEHLGMREGKSVDAAHSDEPSISPTIQSPSAEDREQAAWDKAAADIGEPEFWAHLSDIRETSIEQLGLLRIWCEATARIMRNAPQFLAHDWAGTDAVREAVAQILRIALDEATRANNVPVQKMDGVA